MSSTKAGNPTLTSIRADAVELPALRVVLLERGSQRGAPLELAPVVVGTGEACDLVVADRRVSRRHCEISLTHEGVILRDLGSKNGTFVGGLSVREVLLPPDVTVTVGDTRLMVRVVGAPSVLALWPNPRFGSALGGSIAMRSLFATLARAAKTDETILLEGESGTGKEVLARSIHALSPRAGGPFTVLDCAGLAPTLVEAELFGSVRGAFTGAGGDRAGIFADAHGGTLFIDELGELPIDVQPKLLRALETRTYRPVGASDWRPFDVRIVAATHRDLRQAVATGTFRDDLFYRLAVVAARVPALRERRDDIELLVEHFLAAQRPPRSLHDLPPNMMAMLRAHDYPGHVRELRNVLARLTVFPEMGLEAFDGAVPAATEGAAARDPWAPWLGMELRAARDQVVDRFEASYLVANQRACGGNVARMAEVAGVSKQMIYRLLERHGIRPRGSG